MVDEVTLELIVERVLAALAEREAAAAPRRQVLALFTGAGAGYLAGMEAIHQLTRAQHKLTVVLSPAAEYMIGIDKVKAAGATSIIEPGQFVCAPAMVEKTDLVIVPTMSMNLAARLAVGLMDSLVATLIMGSLLAGKPVLALRAGADPYGLGGETWGDNTGAPALRARMAQNLETIAGYGMTLVEEAQFLPTMRAFLRGRPVAGVEANGQRPAPAPTVSMPTMPPPSSIVGNGSGPKAANGPQFITESDLLTMQPGATVRLNESCRLTPLAQDTARRLRLRLVYE